jgi:hypothetical protein
VEDAAAKALLLALSQQLIELLLLFPARLLFEMLWCERLVRFARPADPFGKAAAELLGFAITITAPFVEHRLRGLLGPGGKDASGCGGRARVSGMFDSA